MPPPADPLPAPFTAEQVMALAPDAASAKAGRGLANARKWVSFGRNQEAVWGECQGSGQKPYQTVVTTSVVHGPAFRCSCPSRKLPCKHGIGLLLLLAAQPGFFTTGDAPPWVTDWLAGRAQRAQRRAGRSAAPDAKAQAQRQADRESKVAAGVEELELWLRDLVRLGLASTQEKPARFWESIAARMVDAQAPGLARLLRNLAGIPASGSGWQERLAERLGRIHLLLQAYHRLDSLPPETQADVRDLIGWAQSQDELLSADDDRALRPQGVSKGRWLVLSHRVETEDRLRVQRTWLWNEIVQQAALVLSFAATGQGLDTSLPPGTAFDAELVYYPSAYPLRALVKQREAAQPLDRERPSGREASLWDGWSGYAGLDAAHAAYSAALARHPWLEQFPVPLRAVIPILSADRWWIRDSDGRAWPLAPHFNRGWELLALSGGQPITLFGEWDGEHLLPLSVWAEGRFVML